MGTTSRCSPSTDQDQREMTIINCTQHAMYLWMILCSIRCDVFYLALGTHIDCNLLPEIMTKIVLHHESIKLLKCDTTLFTITGKHKYSILGETGPSKGKLGSFHSIKYGEDNGVDLAISDVIPHRMFFSS